MKILKSLFTLFCFLFIFFAYGQESFSISGQVKDSLNLFVPYATITGTSLNNTSNIVAYTTTNNKGNYKLIVPSKIKEDSLLITFRHLSYTSYYKKVANYTQKLNATLYPKTSELDEVLVNASKKVTVKGDTITYNVTSLKKEKDYTIEDVINRIPGVEIAENGTISYEGRTISHFYINGVDLLEGSYNVATRGIPAEAVKDVEILQKHNHARIDKGVTASNDVAFNIKIKKNKSLVFGSSKADIGFPFLTARGEVTPIIIRDKIQNIASLKANNFGVSLTDNGTDLTQSNINISAIKPSDVSLLTKPNTSGYGISSKYWLDNNSNSVTNNFLIKLTDSSTLKVIGNYNSGKEGLKRQSNSIYFSGNDSIVVNRKSENSSDVKNYAARLVYESNKKESYLKNTALVEGTNFNGFTNIVQNENAIKHNVNSENFKISNLLEFKNKLGERILNNGFLVGLSNTDEFSKTNSAVYTEITTSLFQPTDTKQTINSQSFNLGYFSEITFPFLKANWTANQSISYISQLLNSDLSQVNENQRLNIDYPFKNRFQLNTFKTNSSINVAYKWHRFNLSFNPELEYINLAQEETLNQPLNNKNAFLFFQPSLNFGYEINSKWNTSSSFSIKNDLSKLNDLYSGFVLKSLSNLYRNPQEINKITNYNGNVFINYNDILNGFIFSNSSNYNKNISDFTFARTLDENGLFVVDALPIENTSVTFSNSSNLTKRFFKILETNLSYRYSYNETNQFFNNSFQSFVNTFNQLSLELEVDNGTWYGIKNTGSFSYGTSKSDQFNSSSFFIKNNFEFDIYTSSKARLNFDYEHNFTQFSTNTATNNNSLFSSSFYYKPNKKLFLRVQLLNIFNEKVFSSVFNSANSNSVSFFNLRPRQFTFGLNYSL